MARTTVTPDSLLFVYLLHYDPEFVDPAFILPYFGNNFNFYFSHVCHGYLVFHDARMGLLFRFLTDIPLQISVDPYLVSTLFPPEPESENYSVQQAQDPNWYEYINSFDDDVQSDTPFSSSGSGSTRQLNFDSDSDETQPPDPELENVVEVDSLSDSVSEDGYDSQEDLFA
jgi:hypothetical protein